MQKNEAREEFFKKIKLIGAIALVFVVIIISYITYSPKKWVIENGKESTLYLRESKITEASVQSNLDTGEYSRTTFQGYYIYDYMTEDGRKISGKISLNSKDLEKEKRFSLKEIRAGQVFYKIKYDPNNVEKFAFSHVDYNIFWGIRNIIPSY